MLSHRHMPPLSFFFTLLAIYIGFVAFLYVFQEQLIFFPQRITEQRWKQVAEDLQAELITIRTDDGVTLRGWFLPEKSVMLSPSTLRPSSGQASLRINGDEAQKPTILFFGGNAMRMDLMAYLLKERLGNANVNLYLVDYRGYGVSEGKPSAEALKNDAVTIFDAAVHHPRVDSDHIIAWGISLGAGVATHLASVRTAVPRTPSPTSDEVELGGAGVEKLILFSPFTSTVDVGFSSFPFVPKPLIRLLLRHKLDILSLAPALTQPVLIVQGMADRQIPPKHAKKVAAAWGALHQSPDGSGAGQGPAELLMVPGRGHNDLFEDEGVWEKIVEFVQE